MLGACEPNSVDELQRRARNLAGRCLLDLGRELDGAASMPNYDSRSSMLHRKGKTGQLIERALGAYAGSRSVPDFERLGIELKTLPVDARGRPRESTYVCTLPLSDVERADWCTCSVRAKLQHVLFVPIVQDASVREGRPTIGVPLFWQPNAAQESILRADFDDLIGMIALGHIEALSAHHGQWLQVRPKAAHGRVRTRAYAGDGELVETIPRGFYLRARVTQALLRDPAHLPADDLT